MKYVLATQAIEGMPPSPEAITLCEKIVAGQITADTAIEKIKQKYGIASSNEALTDDEKIDCATVYILEKYRSAFEELAK